MMSNRGFGWKTVGRLHRSVGQATAWAGEKFGVASTLADSYGLVRPYLCERDRC